MRTILIITLATFFFNCSNRSIDRSLNTSKDTLKYNLNLSKIDDPYFLKTYNSYSERHGLIIQNYYRLIDSLPIDLNSDHVLDEILIFSPLSLDDPAYSDPRIDSVPKRLLLEVINNGNKKVIRRSIPPLHHVQ